MTLTTTVSQAQLKGIREQEFRVSNTVQKCYIGIKASFLFGEDDDTLQVVDVTDYLGRHPGGDIIMLMNSGKDATKEFRDVRHSQFAFSEARKRIIGKIVADAETQNMLRNQGEQAFEEARRQNKLRARINKYIRIVAGTLIVGTVVLLGIRYIFRENQLVKQIKREAVREVRQLKEARHLYSV